jgi:transcriptional regulator with XRE-family HTH domain
MVKINALMPEPEILKELGARLARIRKQQGISQTELAQGAGIGVATLRRIEAGQDSQLVSWLKLMKTLHRLPAVEALLPEDLRSPRAEVRKASRRRGNPAGPAPVVWGDKSA